MLRIMKRQTSMHVQLSVTCSTMVPGMQAGSLLSLWQAAASQDGGMTEPLTQSDVRRYGDHRQSPLALLLVPPFISSVQLLSRFRLCDPMNYGTPGLPIHHQLPESTQTHVHPVDDAIQPSHPLSSPSPPALNLSQHQGLFK